jgi:hypothetical protein
MGHKVAPTNASGQPPHDLDAELSVLSLMLRVSTAVERAATKLQSGDFFDLARGRTFEACVAVHRSGQRAEPVAVASELRKRGESEPVGGWMAKLVELEGSVGVIENLDAYVRSVRHAAEKRRAAACFREALEAINDPTKTAAEIYQIVAGNGTPTGGRKSPNAMQGGALKLDDVEPWPETVDGPPLFAEIVLTIEQFVVMRRSAAMTVALWCAITYLTDAVDVLPRLSITSPTRECGKSRLLAVVGALVQRPLVASSITPAALFRAIQAARPTLLLDEMDNARLVENDELRAILNSGHTRASAWTVRTVGEQHEPRQFSTWAPIGFASIGSLPDTITSRSVRVPLRRRRPSERVLPMRESRLTAELEPLRRRLARWCTDHAQGVAGANPALPDALADRAADNWAPLLAIAHQIGGDWPQRALGAAVAEVGQSARESLGEMLLRDIRDIFHERRIDRLPSRDLAASLGSMESRPWPDMGGGRPITQRGIARLLAPFGMEPRNLKLPAGVVAKGYHAEQFQEAWEAYCPPQEVENPLPRYQPRESQSEYCRLTVTGQAGVADENALPPAPIATGSVVADSVGGARHNGTSSKLARSDAESQSLDSCVENWTPSRLP